MTFDSWEVTVRPDDDYLMHWGIPGMKHGRRRYQNEDGTWTQQGLEERRKREGFGDGKEARKVARAEKKIAKVERRQARKAARAEKAFARSEAKRKKSISGLTDEELEAKIKRAQMEKDYRELTKKQRPVLETGAKIVTRILDYKDAKEQRVIDLNRQKIEMARIKANTIQSKSQAIQSKNAAISAKYQAKSDKYQISTEKHKAQQAKQEARKTKAEVRGGMKYEKKAKYLDSKAKYKEAKRGAIGTFFKNLANKDKEKRDSAHELAVITAKGKSETDKQYQLAQMAKAKADQEKYAAQAEMHKASQEKSKASQEQSKASQAETNRRANETKARTEHLKTKYNRDADRIREINAGKKEKNDYKRDKKKHRETMYKLKHPLSNIP